MSSVGFRLCSVVAPALACALGLAWAPPDVLGQDRPAWTDPPALQPPAAQQPGAAQPTPPPPEPPTPPPARPAVPLQPAATPAPSARPAPEVARPAAPPRQILEAEPRTASTPRQILEAEPRTAAAPRTRDATPPRPAPLPQRPVARAEPRRDERPRLVEAEPRPSFDCGAARTRVELAICDDPVLAAKDRRMALLYEQRGGSRFRPVDERQWRWLATREACGRRPRDVLEACIARTYDARIAELSGF